MKNLTGWPVVRVWGVGAALTAALTACGDAGDSGLTAARADGVAISGVVSAPGGQLAAIEPGFLERVLAALWGAPAQAGLDDRLAPVAGVSVTVYEVDADGNPVGDPVSTGTTGASGEFALTTPALGGRYLVRAGDASTYLDSRIDGETMDVDPASDAVSRIISDLVGEVAALDRLEAGEIREMERDVTALAAEVDTAGAGTAQALSTALKQAAEAAPETLNLIQSATAQGQVCGRVVDGAGQGVAGLLIVARDYGDWVTRARTRTAADGSYCLNLPRAGDANPFTGGTFSGEYILGALNLSCTLGLASEWWSTGGAAYNAFEAEKVRVADSTTLTRDFQLADGLRIQGTVSDAFDDRPVEGVRIVVRDFDSRTPIAATRSRADGRYCVNVAPDGKYLLSARNQTIQPYASEVYDGASGSNNRNHGKPVTGAAGEIQTIDFPLEAGVMLSGTVTDGGLPVAGVRVMVNTDGPTERLRTNKRGKYRVWVRPDVYAVYARGQSNLAVDLGSGNQVVDFTGTVSAIDLTLKNPDGAPVNQAKVFLYDSAGSLVGFEVSNSDGSLRLHSDRAGDHTLLIKVDMESNGGSSVYLGQTRMADATSVSLATVGESQDLGEVTLAAPGVLRAIVYTGNDGDRTAPWANHRFQLRSGGTAPADRFVGGRSRGDGSFVLSLPAGTYARLKLRDAANGGNCDNVVIEAGKTTLVEYFDGDGTCRIGLPG